MRSSLKGGGGCKVVNHLVGRKHEGVNDVIALVQRVKLLSKSWNKGKAFPHVVILV